MNKATPKVGDRIEVLGHHRFSGEEGTIVAHKDNPHAVDHHYHIRFQNHVGGAIKGKEIWMSATDFRIVEEGPADYQPPTDIEVAGTWVE